VKFRAAEKSPVAEMKVFERAAAALRRDDRVACDMMTKSLFLDTYYLLVLCGN
jgi:hypothetical protein